jgi:hypothetical protein
VLTADGVAVDPSKIEAVAEWKQPQNVSDIRSFLGLAGYYPRFIENFHKNTPFVWNEACEQSFQELKKRLMTTPILALPDIHQNFMVYCDASKQGLGCVLMQNDRVIAYAS